VSTKESILFTHFSTALTLLEMGLTYTEIKNLSDVEVTLLLATNASFHAFKNEQMERNAMHQQAASSHPQRPKGY